MPDKVDSGGKRYCGRCWLIALLQCVSQEVFDMMYIELDADSPRRAARPPLYCRLWLACLACVS